MKITRTSMLSGIERTRDLEVTEAQMAAFQAGTHIQNAMPHLTDDEREFILTGGTSEEWDEAFGEEDDEGEEYTPEQRAEAKADLDRYCKLMTQPEGWRGCLQIERKWGLDGLTPAAATSALFEIAEPAP